jgi:hypothetical protein
VKDRAFIGVIALLLVLGCEHEAERGSPIPADKTVNFSHAHTKLAEILTHVSDGLGGVDYQRLQNNPDELKDYLKLTGSVPRSQYDTWSKPERMAFLLNVYNAATMKLGSGHYPVSSIKNIGGTRSVWDLKVVSLFGQKITLGHLEHEMIRKEFQSPSVHFALVCGSKGCPALRKEPYTSKNLEEQFAQQVKSFLGDQDKNRVDLEKKTVYLSPISKWYKKDFGKSDMEILEYVADHFSEAEKSAIKGGGFTIGYTEYDWGVNSAN